MPQTRLYAHPSRKNNAAQGGNDGIQYVNPVPGQSLGRTDQGVDIAAPPGTPVYAIADEKLVGVIPDWFRGQPFYYFKELGSGVINYVAEQFRTNLKVGDTVHAGQQIGSVAPSGTGLELGFAKNEAAARAGHPSPGYTEGTAMPLGRQYRTRVFEKGSTTRTRKTGSAQGNNEAIQQAAKQWGIPVSILTGVYGMETDFGKNIATSSAGAVGAFQFLPSTAKGYSYPLTNHPDPQQFAQQANAAAHYISDLVKQNHGDMNAALLAYSGGGYGLKAVQQKAPRGRNFGNSGGGGAVTRPGGDSPGQPTGPDVMDVLSGWAEGDDGTGSDAQFASFGPGLIPTPLGIIPNPLNFYKGLTQSINGTTDFLKLLAWIINPVNILRMVELLIGLAFMGFGFQAMLQAYGEGKEGFVTSENSLSRSGLGRVSRELASAAMTAVPEAKAAKTAGAKAGKAKAGKASSDAPRRRKMARPAAAPHRTRRQALRLRYEREKQVSDQRTKARRAH